MTSVQLTNSEINLCQNLIGSELTAATIFNYMNSSSDDYIIAQSLFISLTKDGNSSLVELVSVDVFLGDKFIFEVGRIGVRQQPGYLPSSFDKDHSTRLSKHLGLGEKFESAKISIGSDTLDAQSSGTPATKSIGYDYRTQIARTPEFQNEPPFDFDREITITSKDGRKLSVEAHVAGNGPEVAIYVGNDYRRKSEYRTRNLS